MKRVFVLFIVGVVLFGACSAQNANNAQRIIGTWDDNVSGDTWVFNANGTLTRGSYECKFGVTDTQLAISVRYTAQIASLTIYNISISSDGRTLILKYIDDGNTVGCWLTKRQ